MTPTTSYASFLSVFFKYKVNVHLCVVLKTCRNELHAAKEQKNEMEQRYSDNLKEIETAKKDYDDVKKFCEVIVF